MTTVNKNREYLAAVMGGAIPNDAALVAGLGTTPELELVLAATDDPQVFLIGVMNSPLLDPKLRMAAATALMPYRHRKLGETGKKEARKDDASEALRSGKFRPGRAPLRAVGND
jgi:phage terminase small subunit